MNQAFVEKLENCQTLPSLPIIAMQVIEHAKKDDSDSALIADILEKDPAMASKIVALANSAANFPRSPIVTVQDAITRMGLDMTMTLALSFSFAKAMHDCNMNSMDHEVFWRRCLVSGLAARTIARHLKLEKPERFFLAGLIQDIGMLAMNEIEPDRYGVVYHSAADHAQLYLFEKAEFGTTHAEAGAWLLDYWGMPEFYVDLIRESHTECDKSSSGETKSIAFACKYAELWVQDNAEEKMSFLISNSDKCQLFSNKEIAEIIDAITAQIPSINNIFETNIETDFSPAELIEEAKHLLVERNLKLMQQLASARSEVKEARASERQLKEQLKKDQLTGVFNRAHIENISEKAFIRASKTGKPLTIMFLDVDHFKQVNDKYGHQMGDYALKIFARALAKYTGKSGYVGRYGGEEFVIVMPDISSDVAMTIAKRLREGLKKTPVKMDNNLRITLQASIGIATHAPGAKRSFNSVDKLLDAADKTMYRAKHTGRDKAIVYTP